MENVYYIYIFSLLNGHLNIFFSIIFLIFSDVFENSYLKYVIYVWSIQVCVISRLQRPTLHKLLNPAYISNLKDAKSRLNIKLLIYVWSIQQSLSNTYNDPTPHKILNPSYISNLLIELFSRINNTLMKQAL